jgi:hypothetical protein
MSTEKRRGTISCVVTLMFNAWRKDACRAIGGIGPAATEFYYRNLMRAHAAANWALELTIAHADIHDLSEHERQCPGQTSGDIFCV